MSQLETLGGRVQCSPVKSQAGCVNRGPFGPWFSSQAYDYATAGPYNRFYQVTDDLVGAQDEAWISLGVGRSRDLHAPAEQGQ